MRTFLVSCLLALLGLQGSTVEIRVPASVGTLSARSVDRRSQVEAVEGSVCRVDTLDGGHGSGVAYRVEDGYTYILTARHVAAGFPRSAWPEVRFSVVFSQGTRDIREEAEIFELSDKTDLASLRVKDSLLKVASLADRGVTWKPGRELLAMGFPRDFFPVATTYGFANGYNDQWMSHTVDIRYGNSGGPILLFDTLEIIGICVHFDKYSSPMRGDRSTAVSLYAIHTFLEWAHSAHSVPSDEGVEDAVAGH